MLTRTRRSQGPVSAWPGYVDVLSALLMVVIFVLMIFTFSQFLLNEILTGQESELATLHRRLNELTELLGLERQKNKELTVSLDELSGIVEHLSQEETRLNQRVEELVGQTKADRQTIERQLMKISSLQEDIDALEKLGTGKLFTPGTSTAEIIEYITAEVKKRKR